MRLIYLFLFSLLPVFANASNVALTRVADATVTLVSADGRDSFLGSGFVYRTPRRVITNAHVVGRADRVVVIAADGRRIAAEVVRHDELVDLAELQLDAPAPVVLEAAEVPELGAPVYAMGAPLQAGSTLTDGILSNLGRQVDPVQPVRYLQHSAAVNPGSSGGPLVDATGKVIGVNTRIADGSRFFIGIAYAVPVAVIDRFLNGRSFGPETAPGILVRPMTPAMAKALDVVEPGVLIDHVAAGSPANAAGLLPGDILVAVAATPIALPGDIAFALHDAGTLVEVTVLRAGKRLSVTLDLGRETPALEAAGVAEIASRAAYSFAAMGITADADGTITKMGDKGAGFFAGLSEGDRIVAINGVSVDALVSDWPTALSITALAVVLIRLPDGATRHFTLDPWATGKGLRPVSGANVLDQAVVGFD